MASYPHIDTTLSTTQLRSCRLVSFRVSILGISLNISIKSVQTLFFLTSDHVAQYINVGLTYQSIPAPLIVLFNVHMHSLSNVVVIFTMCVYTYIMIQYMCCLYMSVYLYLLFGVYAVSICLHYFHLSLPHEHAAALCLQFTLVVISVTTALSLAQMHIQSYCHQSFRPRAFMWCWFDS